jgi:hypothetical protein
MKFMTTPDQDYILTILKETKSMRKSQALALLNKLDIENDALYLARLLEQLRHMRKITWLTGGLFTLKPLWSVPADAEMLSAIDIMLDLTDIRVQTVTARTAPYKLCFLSEQKDGIGNYAVCVLHPGTEAAISAMLHSSGYKERTVVFLLSALSQAEKIKTPLPHFFAIFDGGRYKYFSGGG